MQRIDGVTVVVGGVVMTTPTMVLMGIVVALAPSEHQNLQGHVDLQG